MERFYNIAGPCNPARHYMLSAMARLAVFDPDLGGDWDAKLSHEDINWGGKTVHLFRC